MALGVEVLINTVLKSGCGEGGTTPPILIMSPILVGENIGETWLDGMFGGWERGKLSLDFARHFKTVADKYHCHFLDAAQYARPSDEDCIHIRLEDHRPLGEAVAAKIREILG